MTVGAPADPTVNHTVFDHTSVLKMIESVFNVKPLAARETSNDVGNLLTAINLNNPPAAAPALPHPQAVAPQNLCVSSIAPGGGSVPLGRLDDEARAIVSRRAASPPSRHDDEASGFQRLHDAAVQRGWRVY